MSELTTVDARGLSCPQPVLMAKRALEKLNGGHVEVLVDTVTSRENVCRFARNAGWSAEAKPDGDGFKVMLNR